MKEYIIVKQTKKELIIRPLRDNDKKKEIHFNKLLQ